MSNPQADQYIRNLEKEKRELQGRIDELRRNIIAIDSLIIKRRAQLIASTHGTKITMKNADRLFFEALILDIIRKSRNGMRTADVQKEIKNRGYRLNYNTLRAYMVSCRDSGKIIKSKKFIYNWVLPDDESSA
jgi:hypothetical protein